MPLPCLFLNLPFNNGGPPSPATGHEPNLLLPTRDSPALFPVVPGHFFPIRRILQARRQAMPDHPSPNPVMSFELVSYFIFCLFPSVGFITFALNHFFLLSNHFLYTFCQKARFRTTPGRSFFKHLCNVLIFNEIIFIGRVHIMATQQKNGVSDGKRIRPGI